eukprot:202671_1
MQMDDDEELDSVFLEWWRAYTLDEVIDLLDNRTHTDVPRGNVSDGYYEPCPDHVWQNTTYGEPCINNTWFPDVCSFNNSGEHCATLFQWLPSYNGYEDRDIIQENDMRLKITYFGGEWTFNSQTFMAQHFMNQSRVLWSVWSPTIWTASDDFIEIGYPIDDYG